MNVTEKIKSLINSQKFLAILLALVLSTLLIGFAPSSIALGIFIFFSIRYAIIHKQKLKIDLVLLLPVVIYILFILTLFWTVDLYASLNGLRRTIALILVPFAFSLLPAFSLKNYDLTLKYFTRVNILLGLFFVIVSLIRYSDTKEISVFMYHDFVNILRLNAIYVSSIFTMSIFYLLSKDKRSTIDKLAILFLTYLILMLSSKMILFIMLLGYLIYAFSIWSKKKYRLGTFLIGVSVILLIGLTFSGVLNRFLVEKNTNIKEVLSKEKFGKIYPWTGSSIRILQLRILNEQIDEESIFWKGFGLYASQENIKNRQIKLDIYKGFHDINYHNQYAQIFSEIGIFALILLIHMLFLNIKNAVKSKNFLFLMFSLSIPLIFITESFLWRQRGMFLFIILYCLLNRTTFTADKKEFLT
ncbi:MAG: hypothetical protein DRI95_13900 [Bacteroidetes bacterium]|nr:MAG: hypothetical protein DRI95_13900 [Bacteroidota bacterium]